MMRLYHVFFEYILVHTLLYWKVTQSLTTQRSKLQNGHWLNRETSLHGSSKGSLVSSPTSQKIINTSGSSLLIDPNTIPKAIEAMIMSSYPMTKLVSIMPPFIKSFMKYIYPGELLLLVIFQLTYSRILKFAHKTQRWVWKVLEKGSPVEWNSSILGFIEARCSALSNLMSCNYIAKLLCLVLAKLGLNIRSDFPNLLSNISYTLFMAQFLDQFKSQFLRTFFPKIGESRRSSYMVNKLSSVAIWTIGGLVVCEMLSAFLKVPLSSTLAFGGVGGLAVGLSLRDIAANFLGGMLLLINEPFTPGDMITFKSEKTEVVGRVERVGWGQTRIRGRDTRPTYVPNAHFVQTAVTNMERITHRRFETTVPIRFVDYPIMNDVINRIKDRLKTISKLDVLSMPFRVSFVKVGSYCLEIEITCYFATKSIDEFLALQQSANMEVIAAIHECGAQLALPTTVMQVDQSTIIRNTLLNMKEEQEQQILREQQILLQHMRDQQLHHQQQQHQEQQQQQHMTSIIQRRPSKDIVIAGSVVGTMVNKNDEINRNGIDAAYDALLDDSTSKALTNGSVNRFNYPINNDSQPFIHVENKSTSTSNISSSEVKVAGHNYTTTTVSHLNNNSNNNIDMTNNTPIMLSSSTTKTLLSLPLNSTTNNSSVITAPLDTITTDNESSDSLVQPKNVPLDKEISTASITSSSSAPTVSPSSLSQPSSPSSLSSTTVISDVNSAATKTVTTHPTDIPTTTTTIESLPDIAATTATISTNEDAPNGDVWYNAVSQAGITVDARKYFDNKVIRIEKRDSSIVELSSNGAFILPSNNTTAKARITATSRAVGGRSGFNKEEAAIVTTPSTQPPLQQQPSVNPKPSYRRGSNSSSSIDHGQSDQVGESVEASAFWDNENILQPPQNATPLSSSINNPSSSSLVSSSMSLSSLSSSPPSSSMNSLMFSQTTSVSDTISSIIDISSSSIDSIIALSYDRPPILADISSLADTNIISSIADSGTLQSSNDDIRGDISSIADIPDGVAINKSISGIADENNQ